MCSVMAGLTALGGYMQYRSQQQAGKAQAAMYHQQAQAAQQNAKIEARRQEQMADNYQQQQRDLRSRQRLQEGALRAQTGSAGLNFTGSPMDILTSSYDAAKQDQLNLLSNQRNDNYSSRVAESNYINQAAAANAAASNARHVARMQGIGTILGTAASVYGMMNQPTAPKPAEKPHWTLQQDNLGYSNNPGFMSSTFTEGKGYSFQTYPTWKNLQPKTWFDQDRKTKFRW